MTALKMAGGAAALLALGAPSLRQLGLRGDAIRRLNDPAPASWSAWLRAAHHHLVVPGSPHYPDRLAETDDAPLALWVEGEDLALLGAPQLAIVGSRHPTRNGAMTAKGFASRLSASGLTITSGLAAGIDAAAHSGALDGVGGTIAVLGSGIDQIYPEGNGNLARKIARQGLIVSEYGPETGVRAWQFPERNRIIAALSLGTLVVEATSRSGSLITARLAAEFGREVFSVPGSIHSALSKGCHKLIGDGAKLVETVDDVLRELAPQIQLPGPNDTGDGEYQSDADFPPALRNTLEFSPITLDELLGVTGLTAGELSSMLLHLEIQGKIEALPGGRYCRLKKRAR